jgi:hypothetical protein
MWSPLYQVGSTTTLSRLGDSVPSVLYANVTSGNDPPFCNAKFVVVNVSRLMVNALRLSPAPGLNVADRLGWNTACVQDSCPYSLEFRRGATPR